MSSGTFTVLVSLQEPVVMLKTTLWQYASALVQQNMLAARLDAFDPGGLSEYDTNAYMTQMIQQIFEPVLDSALEASVTPSVKLLLEAGVSYGDAVSIDSTVFRFTVDAICAAMPGIAFGQQDGFVYDFVAPFDLMISAHKSQLQS